MAQNQSVSVVAMQWKGKLVEAALSNGTVVIHSFTTLERLFGRVRRSEIAKQSPYDRSPEAKKGRWHTKERRYQRRFKRHNRPHLSSQASSDFLTTQVESVFLPV